MNDRTFNIADEVRSIGRKADQACSIHAYLRDQYERCARLLDYSLMAASTYLLGLSFVEPVIGLRLSLGADPKILIASLSLITFFLSIVQFKSDWKTRAQEHSDSFDEHAAIKSDCRAITSGTRAATTPELQRIRDRYDRIAEIGTPIPENQFVKGKARHLRKVYVSRYLDSHPGAFARLVAIKLVFRDNFGINVLAKDEPNGTGNTRP
jgi:hypothetical protein